MAVSLKLVGKLPNKALQQEVADAQGVNHGHWFDGVPVAPQMNNFLSQLKESMPRLKFIPCKLGRLNVFVKAVTEFYVYMDDQPYVLGKIGFAIYKPKANEPMFMVYSRKIENGKYGSHRDEHHMAMSKDIKTSVRNARKYLVPMTHAEIGRALYEDVKYKQHEVRDVPIQTIEKLVYAVSGMRRLDLMREIQSLTLQGVEFKSEEFKRASAQCVELLDQYGEESRRQVELVFVRVRNVGDEQYVDVSGNIDAFKTDTDQKTYRVDELPEDIAGSISVLSILTDGQYVPRVGQRVDENMYWIERG